MDIQSHQHTCYHLKGVFCAKHAQNTCWHILFLFFRNEGLTYKFASLNPGFTYNISIEVISQQSHSGTFSRTFTTSMFIIEQFHCNPSQKVFFLPQLCYKCFCVCRRCHHCRHFEKMIGSPRLIINKWKVLQLENLSIKQNFNCCNFQFLQINQNVTSWPCHTDGSWNWCNIDESLLR